MYWVYRKITDIKYSQSGFLNREVEEEIYAYQLETFVNKAKADHVLELRSYMGSNKAPKRGIKNWRKVLLNLGFVQQKCVYNVSSIICRWSDANAWFKML